MRTPPLLPALAIALTALLQTPGADAQPRDTTHARASEAKMPREREYSYIYDLMDNSLIRPITRVLDPGLWVRKIGNDRREAENVDEHDQVRLPSTWWQPRIGYRPVTVEQMLTGPGDGKGPAPGPWRLTKGKSQGITPGFQMKDSKDQLWFIKFDLPANPELTTSVEVVGTHLYWAAGYNVADAAIAFFRPESLVIDPKATFTDPYGRKKPFTRANLDVMLGRVARQRDGRFRVVASKALKGKPIGPFEYNGRRRDDPEDLIPHELRRELRGLWTLNAWTNHADCRGPNSLDVWVTENGRSFVRHHLLDFSGLLGSGGLKARSYSTGFEYYLDFNVMARAALTLGLAPFAWEDVVDPSIASVGFVEWEQFDPSSWKPDYPNPAFDDRTTRDVRWGARILAAFTDEHIRAAVATGQYSDPRAIDYLIRTLIHRRDKLVRYWLAQDAGRLSTTP